MLLRIGNYLNFGTNKGNAYGFGLQTLAQLDGVKSMNGSSKKISLMDFLITNIRTKEPRLLDLVQDLLACEDASKLDISAIETKFKEMTSGLEHVQNFLETTRSKAEQL